MATFSPLIHLAIVFGVVFKERCLAVTDPDHAAIVWVVITVLAEKLPTKQILLLAGDVGVLCGAPAEAVVGCSGVLIIAVRTALYST